MATWVVNTQSFCGFDCLEDLIILKDTLEHFMTESQQNNLEHFMTESQQNKSQQFFY
jgi:hypothetical protein